MMRPLKTICSFYLEGFRSMDLGRTLWKIVILKLLILFFILRPIFFSDNLQSRFDNDRDRADHVFENLMERTTIETSVQGRIP